MSGTERYVNAREAAEHCGVTERTVRQWVKDRKVPARKVGAAFRIPLSALEPLRRAAEASGRQGAEAAEVAEPSATQGGSDGRNDAEAPSAAPLLEALRQLEAVRRENVQLAGQVGYLQRQVQEQSARLLALEAPKEPAPAVDAAERAHSAILTASGAETTREPSTGRQRPWWRFWG